jgi:predicted RNA-binding protein associated with RNAse of E/G family
VDLEVDVIRRGEEEPFIVDRDALAILAEAGRITVGLEKMAGDVAEKLIEGLR